MLIFSTNLKPQDLADEAFWRRIKYKLEMPNPTEKDFEQIFRTLCEKNKIGFDLNCYEYLIQTYYRSINRELRAVHPRDLLNQMRDHISYKGLEPKLSQPLIDLACQLYFSSVDTAAQDAWKS